MNYGLLKMRLLATLAAASCALGTVGCGSGNYPVSGTAKIKGGGPLTTGNVQFQSEQHTGTGVVDQNGKFTVSSSGPDDGLPPGTYKVLFLSTATGGGYDNPDEPEKRVIHTKYESAETTDLQTTVGPDGESALNFELDPYEGS